MEQVYLIHLHERYYRAQHYLGTTKNLDKRMWQHFKGKKSGGSPLLEAARKANIAWSVVRTWEGGRSLERQLKNRHNSKLLCPICREKHERIYK